MIETDICIIGAGVVGLSVCASVSGQNKGKRILLLEKNSSFGRETSSRNSEVIHASIYYPQDSLKGRLCLEGNEMMYELCRKNNIPHKNNGKLIVACTEEEREALPELLVTAKSNGARGVRLIDEKEIKKLEPNVSALAAMYCPSSGIVDSHSLMQFFEAKAVSNGADVVYNNELAGIDRKDGSYILSVKDDSGNITKVNTKILINCAGLGSGHVSAMAGIDIKKEGYEINWAKGMYFRVHGNLEQFPQMLIYPVPPAPAAVGIHTTPDMGGGMRLGPYDIWVDEIDYSVDESLKEFFYEAAKPFLPYLDINDIQPDTAGIHPKIQKKGQGMKDFIIRHEHDKGLENFINLVGIESPGLTSSPAIGKMLAAMVGEIF